MQKSVFPMCNDTDNSEQFLRNGKTIPSCGQGMSTPPVGHSSKGGGFSNSILNTEITAKIAQQIRLTFVSEKEAEGNVCMANSSEVRLEYRETFSAVDVLDYIYGVIHLLLNQEDYKESLKIDSMKIPLPTDLATFQKFINLGTQFKHNTLLNTPNNKLTYTEFSLEGEYIVAKSSCVNSPPPEGWA